MKKAIVTGANGFVGCAVCKELSDQGVEVIAIVRSCEANISNINKIRGIRIVFSDLSNFGNLSDLIPDRDVDLFFHFAWVGCAGQLRGDANTQIKNVQYTCDTVKSAAEIGCKRFVLASSIMVYEIESIMATEVTPSINTLYCSAKLAADYMARAIAGNLGLDYIRAIISNIYGPNELSPRLVNTCIRKMLKGEHCAFTTGEQMYDFIYISDAAKSFYAIGTKGKSNKAYYIGSNDIRPLRAFLEELRDCVDPDIKLGFGEIPFNGSSLTYKEFDTCSVRNDTGFIPEVTFTEGIKKTVAWLKEIEQC